MCVEQLDTSRSLTHEAGQDPVEQRRAAADDGDAGPGPLSDVAQGRAHGQPRRAPASRPGLCLGGPLRRSRGGGQASLCEDRRTHADVHDARGGPPGGGVGVREVQLWGPKEIP